ncbi:MAG: hypothetical protein R3C11_29620 [Planctomycetaceae bacterium]
MSSEGHTPSTDRFQAPQHLKELLMLRPLFCFMLMTLTTLFSPAFTPHAAAAIKPPAHAEKNEPQIEVRQIGSLDWHTDYGAAYKEARLSKKQLLICFELKTEESQSNFEQTVLASEQLSDDLDKFTRVVLPTSTNVPGKEENLLEHASFHHMHRSPGIAVLDLTNEESPLYSLLVSAHPFSYERAYSLDEVSTILSLPSGTITQRTMIYALKRHPERPQSVNAVPHNYLMHMSNVNSSTMARMHQVGHHNWTNRFHQINGAVGGLSSEVAVSGNGYTLLDVANSCIRTWRSSSGHWNSMRKHHRYYGYDMVQSSNGTWYATGIFVD